MLRRLSDMTLKFRCSLLLTSCLWRARCAPNDRPLLHTLVLDLRCKKGHPELPLAPPSMLRLTRRPASMYSPQVVQSTDIPKSFGTERLCTSTGTRTSERKLWWRHVENGDVVAAGWRRGASPSQSSRQIPNINFDFYCASHARRVTVQRRTT